MTRANGSLGSETVLVNNEAIGGFTWQGYDGSTFSTGATLLGIARGTWSGSSRPTAIRFATTASGSTTNTNRWEIDPNGHLLTMTINAYDVASSATPARTGYFGTSVVTPLLSATTRVTSPLLGTTTAVSPVIDRNSVTQVTFNSLSADFAGAVTAAATTDSTSGSTGAINTAGGLGVTKKIYCGTEIEIDGDLNHDGTTVGFYGVAPTTRQVLATGAGATVDNVITALQTLGLVSQT